MVVSGLLGRRGLARITCVRLLVTVVVAGTPPPPKPSSWIGGGGERDEKGTKNDRYANPARQTNEVSLVCVQAAAMGGGGFGHFLGSLGRGHALSGGAPKLGEVWKKQTPPTNNPQNKKSINKSQARKKKKCTKQKPQISQNPRVQVPWTKRVGGTERGIIGTSGKPSSHTAPPAVHLAKYGPSTLPKLATNKSSEPLKKKKKKKPRHGRFAGPRLSLFRPSGEGGNSLRKLGHTWGSGTKVQQTPDILRTKRPHGQKRPYRMNKNKSYNPAPRPNQNPPATQTPPPPITPSSRPITQPTTPHFAKGGRHTAQEKTFCGRVL